MEIYAQDYLISRTHWGLDVTPAANNERIDGSLRYRRIAKICIFVRDFSVVASKYHGAQWSVFDAIRAKGYRRGPRHSTENWKAAREGERGRHPGVPHFPILSLCVTLEYHFSFFPRDIKAAAENRSRSFGFVGWAKVTFSAPDIGNAR